MNYKVNCMSAVFAALVVANSCLAQSAPPAAAAQPALPPLAVPKDPNRRMQPMPEEQWDQEQHEAAAVYKQARKNDPTFGLFNDLLRVPDAMLASFRMRLYVQNKISFGDKLSALGMLVVLREWGQKQEWTGHAVEAVRYGLKPEIVHAIAEGSYPQNMDSDESLIYNFCTELLRVHNVTDGTYDRMIKRFGERGVIEGLLLVNLYSMVGMDLNVVREPVPPGRPEMPDYPQMKSIPVSEYSKLPPLPTGFTMPPARPASPPPKQLTFGK